MKLLYQRFNPIPSPVGLTYEDGRHSRSGPWRRGLYNTTVNKTTVLELIPPDFSSYIKILRVQWLILPILIYVPCLSFQTDKSCSIAVHRETEPAQGVLRLNYSRFFASYGKPLLFLLFHQCVEIFPTLNPLEL
jgi:hypothetical protein